MSQAPDNTGHPGYRRRVNIQKIHPVTGEIVWSRYLLPPFWPVPRINTNGAPITGIYPPSRAIEVEPIHGTNDVVVRLERGGLTGSQCRNAICRVSESGSVQWWNHFHISNPLLTSPFVYTPRAISGLSNGNTLSLETERVVGGGLTKTYNSMRDTAPDGTHANSLILQEDFGPGGSAPMVYQQWTIPESNEVLAMRGYAYGTYSVEQIRETRDRVSVSHSAITNSLTTNITPLVCGPSSYLSAELWYTGLSVNRDTQQRGVTIRELGADYAINYTPPQSDVSASVMDRTFADYPSDVGANPGDTLEASATVLAAYMAATNDGIWYVDAIESTKTTHVYYDPIQSGWYYPGGMSPYNAEDTVANSDHILIAFDSSLSELWRQDIGPTETWAMLADDGGVILGRFEIVSDEPFPRTNYLERRDLNGELVWQQATIRDTTAGSSVDPFDMCFADDGYLYVVG